MVAGRESTPDRHRAALSRKHEPEQSESSSDESITSFHSFDGDTDDEGTLELIEPGHFVARRKAKDADTVFRGFNSGLIERSDEYGGYCYDQQNVSGGDSTDYTDFPANISGQEGASTPGDDSQSGSSLWATGCDSSGGNEDSLQSGSGGEERRHVAPVIPDSIPPARLEHLLATVRRDEDGMITSVGSANHGVSCKPCRFFFMAVGCSNGIACPFCHFKHSRTAKLRPCKGKRDRYRKFLERKDPGKKPDGVPAMRSAGEPRFVELSM